MKRKQICSSPIRDLTNDYGFSPEITLTVVTNDANSYNKRQRRDSEKSSNSSVTLRYKDPKTKAPTEKMLDNDVRHSFDASNESSSCLNKQKNEATECYQRLNKIVNRPEITIYPKQENEKQLSQTVASTSNKSTNHQITDNSQTVYKVSQEVDIISTKSNQKINRKSDCKQVEAIIEAAKKDVPDNNDNDDDDNSGISLQDLNKFDANNNPKQNLRMKISNALAHIQGLEKPSTSSGLSTSTPIKSALDEKQVILRSNSREKSFDNNNQWNSEDDIFANDNSMQSISSTIPFQEQLYNFDNDYENPYYIMGFPNPPGENRCWVNATIHALFALPFTNSLDRSNLTECTSLMKTLISIQALWRKGESEKHRIHSMLRYGIKTILFFFFYSHCNLVYIIYFKKKY